MELNGTIIAILDEVIYDSGFNKREFVIETDGDYPQQIKFELIKDRVSQLDQVEVGDTVDVYFDIKGREYNGNYFVNLQAWKFGTIVQGAPDPNPAPERRQAKAAKPQPAAINNAQEDDDTPF